MLPGPGSWRTGCGPRSHTECGVVPRFRSCSSRRTIESNLSRVEDIATFIGHFPPFDHLEPEELARVAAAVCERSYAAGEDALVEDAEPASHLFVIRSGSMELIHQEEVIDVLEPGECFGHPS